MQAHHQKILKFWRAVEIFTLPDIPAPFKDSDYQRYRLLSRQRELPWEAGVLPALREGRQWRHTLYFYIIDKETVVALLEKLTDPGEYREPVYGQTCLSAMALDAEGRPSKRGYMPASFIYGIQVMERGGRQEEVPDLLAAAQEEYLQRLEVDKTGGVMNWEMLQKELRHVASLTGNVLRSREDVLCISDVVADDAEIEAPFLNSYFMQDLNHLIGLKDLGRPLELFLSERVDEGVRHNLLDRRCLLQKMHPGRQSAGRWPADPRYGLYAMQQAALSMPGFDEIECPVIGVNGPPGTGKTTLLRELVATVVVDRARRLLSADIKKLFDNSYRVVGEHKGYYPTEMSLFGDGGIVVTGANNAAIENISRELPATANIDPETFGQAAYFPEIATVVHGMPAWGMLSAVLGASGKRKEFASRFWFNKGQGFGKMLREEELDAAAPQRNLAGYENTAAQLRSLLDEHDAFVRLASAYHDMVLAGAPCEEPGARLREAYDIESRDLPGPDLLRRPMEKVHRMRPYFSVRLNVLRSRIFLLSLELHAWAIRLHARKFHRNLSLFIDMMGATNARMVDQQVAASLWSTFFFCVPLASVTLASFARQFALVGRGGVGWLVVEEAGQATPAAACGAIWRSQRVVVIGDTLQIPPVVNTPLGLARMLRAAYGVGEEGWDPTESSVQLLADRVTRFGTHVQFGGNKPIWAGVPLRAHRRCREPMFSIANRMAYDGQMVNVRAAGVMEVATGPSCWIDVPRGTALDGHVVVEELEVLRDMLQYLAGFEGKVFVISPFRRLAEACRERCQRNGVSCGTIHSFQGKEAEVVFLVLGTTSGSTRARAWVAERPNMLNVAVTRAKDRLYVIGDRDKWREHRYFDQLAASLPVRDRGLLF